MLAPDYTNVFKKNIKLLERRRKDINKLKVVMYAIMHEIPLPPQYKEHHLHGKFEGTLECHIEPDWVLIYKIDDAQKTVLFHSTGTHSDLF
jgi:mRNA interferase YafQ